MIYIIIHIKYLIISFVIPFVTHEFRSQLFKVQVFGTFKDFHFFSNLISLWLQNTFCKISVFEKLLRLCLNRWPSFNVYPAVTEWGVYGCQLSWSGWECSNLLSLTHIVAYCSVSYWEATTVSACDHGFAVSPLSSCLTCFNPRSWKLCF